MVQGYYLDPDGKVADERFAVVYAPKRVRDRFPAGSVQVVESEAAARAAADPAKKLFPARVIGPARSSEGVFLYYIVAWLDET
jgi:hypothetical protein